MSDEDDDQMFLFDGLHDDPNDWKKHWVGMPELSQEDLSSFRKIVIHFRSEDDVEAFAALIGQQITPRQPSLWFPEMAHRIASDKRWVGTKDEP